MYTNTSYFRRETFCSPLIKAYITDYLTSAYNNYVTNRLPGGNKVFFCDSLVCGAIPTSLLLEEQGMSLNCYDTPMSVLQEIPLLTK